MREISMNMIMQEVSNSLDESSVQVVQSLPRVLRDVEAVKQETILLREQMRIVKEDIKQVHTMYIYNNNNSTCSNAGSNNSTCTISFNKVNLR